MIGDTLEGLIYTSPATIARPSHDLNWYFNAYISVCGQKYWRM